MNAELKKYNDMIDRLYLENWDRRSKLSSIGLRLKGVDKTQLEISEKALKQAFEKNYFKNFPIKLLDIENIFTFIKEKKSVDAEVSRKIAKKLMDIKTLYFFLEVSHDRFDLGGGALIVGKGELEKVNLNTISLLQHNHYKVYLLSCLYENLLDFLDIIFQPPKVKRNSKNKWDKIFNELSNIKDFHFILSEENLKMIDFYGKRNAEIHNISEVFSMLYQDKWDHFQEIENIIKNIVSRLYDKNLYNLES